MSERSAERPGTAHPPLEITAVFPELRDLAATAIRLHPRRGEPGAWDSSLGGPLLWPADEPWPACSEPHLSCESVLADLFDHVPYPMIGVLQVCARDVPELPYPEGTDLCQLLWCPNNHDEPWYGPRPVVAWRHAGSATELLTDLPHTTFDAPVNAIDYVPAPCVLMPERVTEYPHPYDLPDILRQRLQAWDGEQAIDRPYLRLLSTAPGTKLLGHPNWIQGPRWPVCVCGRLMTHLVTIASAEYSDGERWNDVHTETSPHGIMIGDVGDMYLFTCTARNHRPLEGVVQFS